jgi:arylsulfatase A-like enzyme
VTKALVSNVDLAPTILAQAGCNPGKKMKGYDLYEGNIDREFIFTHASRGRNAMARTTNKKLIQMAEHQSLFFDLEKDPLEMKNLYEIPDHQKEIERFKTAITEWEGINEMPEIYLDYDAPQIKQPNVPPDLGHREEIIEYYKNKMGLL